MPTLSYFESDLVDRAIRAFTRGGDRDQPSIAASTVEDIGGKRHVFLRNVRGTLAVYAVKPDGGLARVADERMREMLGSDE